MFVCLFSYDAFMFRSKFSCSAIVRLEVRSRMVSMDG